VAGEPAAGCVPPAEDAPDCDIRAGVELSAGDVGAEPSRAVLVGVAAGRVAVGGRVV
jgi:hypothetical protein